MGLESLLTVAAMVAGGCALTAWQGYRIGFAEGMEAALESEQILDAAFDREAFDVVRVGFENWKA
jgi:hypothetical protein